METSRERSTRHGFDPLRGFVSLERNLAAILWLTPVALILADEGTTRDSISAYHDVAHPEVFYVPLTVAAMLFIVNGVLKHGHWYNWVIGTLLGTLVLFDHESDLKLLHTIGATGFFLGNVAVMIWFSKRKPKAVIVGLVAVIAASVVLWQTTDWFTLFWAEWVSLTIIAAHYILDTLPVSYTALAEGDKVELLPAKQRQTAADAVAGG